jgi:hypothetical protein
MNPAIEAAKAYVLKHRFWFELALYVLVAAGTAVWVGRDAYAQAAVLRTEGLRLESMRVSADRWLASLQPATSAETQEWQQTLAALNQLGAGSDSQLTLVEVITRRAERAGLSNIRALISPADSIQSVPRTGAPPVNFKVAEYAIIVDFKGNLAATRSFLANLPPAVSVNSLSMGKTGPTMGTHVVLTVYEAVADAPI